MTIEQKKSKIGLYVDGVVDSSTQGRFIGACTTIPVIPDDEKADYADMVVLYTGSETGYTANTYYKYSGTAWEKYVPADVANKVDKVSGKGLSTEDFTSALKTKLEGIQTGANAVSYSQTLTSGVELGKITIDDNVTTIYGKDDVSVKQSASSVAKELPILTKTSEGTTAVTGEASFASGVSINPSTKTITATTFKGNLTGKATSAGTADSATSATSATTADSATTAGTADVAKGYTSDGAIATALAEKAGTAVATTTANGLMSSTDKTKLNGIDTDAKNVSFTRSLTSGTKIGTIIISGTATDIYCEKNTNTDTKVTQTVTDTSNTGKYPILIKNTTDTSSTTDKSRFVAGITITPSTGAINATKFVGALDGNATTATTATGFSATGGIATALNGKQDKGDYALRSEIPTKVSTLDNDSGYQTATQVNTAISTATAGKLHTEEEIKAIEVTNAVNASSADVAVKANQDSAGNIITATYATKSQIPSVPITSVKQDGTALAISAGTVNVDVKGTKVDNATHADTAGSATSATTASDYATTGSIKDALDSKQATITGGATSITSSNLTANRALISNASGKVAISAVTSTELGYLDGVTSSIQTQFDGKQAKIISASNISVPANAWATGHADGDFIYRASITLSGCTASMIPAVVFSTADAISGDYSPVCESDSGVINIWSKKNVAITILTALAIPQ